LELAAHPYNKEKLASSVTETTPKKRMTNQRRSGKLVFVVRIVTNQYEDHTDTAWAKCRGLNVKAISTQSNHRYLKN